MPEAAAEALAEAPALVPDFDWQASAPISSK